MKGEIRRLSLPYDREKLLSGEIRHALKQTWTRPWKVGDKALLFHKNQQLLGIAEITKITKFTIEEIEGQRLYKLIDLDEEDWELLKKAALHSKDKWLLFEWEELGIFDKGIK